MNIYRYKKRFREAPIYIELSPTIESKVSHAENLKSENKRRDATNGRDENRLASFGVRNGRLPNCYRTWPSSRSTGDASPPPGRRRVFREEFSMPSPGGGAYSRTGVMDLTGVFGARCCGFYVVANSAVVGGWWKCWDTGRCEMWSSGFLWWNVRCLCFFCNYSLEWNNGRRV